MHILKYIVKIQKEFIEDQINKEKIVIQIYMLDRSRYKPTILVCQILEKDLFY